ncbi:hydantoinase B/oxoprolinase family protein, partial [bacterium]|nr:hydantoinase B/oxoprolinase family protein [bacterium]
MNNTVLHLFADVGGTFTDCIFWQPPKSGHAGRGTFTIKKILSNGTIPVQVQTTDNPKILLLQNFTWEDPSSLSGYTLQINFPKTGQFETKIKNVSLSPCTLTLENPLPQNCKYTFSALIHSGESPAITALRCFTGTQLNQPLPDTVIRYATTTGTNSLLERKGPNTAFVTTSGFEDLLLIGYQDRPDLFTLQIQKPKPLFSMTAGIDEHTAATGRIVKPLNESVAIQSFKHLLEDGAESVAICFLNAWVNPDNELIAGDLAKEAGFTNIFLSHQTSPLIRLVPRADTTVADAYLTPIMSSHLKNIRSKLSDTSSLRIMTSAGGLISSSMFAGRQSILSGPAGGIVALSDVRSNSNYNEIIGFDMGGTSTDVSRFDGDFEYKYHTRIAGIRITTPMLNIETVAAGGGSICRFDGARFRVGPESAGASPGPAAYGKGGPLTITDANVLLGYIPRFPFPLDTKAVETKFDEINKNIVSATGIQFSHFQIAEGFRKIACETMAASIRKISLTRGFDIRNHALCTFGGAGPQHACQIASLLGITTVLIHPLASVLSAYGLCVAPVKILLEKPILEIYRRRYLPEFTNHIKFLHAAASEQITAEGVNPATYQVRTMADMRYLGQSHVLTINFEDPNDIEQLFHDTHKQFYGHTFDGRGIEIAALRLELTGKIETPKLPIFKNSDSPIIQQTTHRMFHGDISLDVPVYYREHLRPSHELTGPALIAGPDTSVFVEPGWQLVVDQHLVLIITKTSVPPIKTPNIKISTTKKSPDPVLLEVFHHRFATIAEQMGVILQKSALSTNIKERLDFSCAVFTSSGHLVANAPHIPVHLGAMGETVRKISDHFPDMSADDVFLTNDPYQGGSHLPDVTVIMPVFDDQKQLCFFTAVRAHHAEIGGISPGSMPSEATNLSQEGVVIPPFQLVSNNKLQLDQLRKILSAGPYPSRNPEDNVSDILAQTAACRRGATLLNSLTHSCGTNSVCYYMDEIRKTSAAVMQSAILQLPSGIRTFTDYLDDGSPITVTIKISNGKAHLDFTGTGKVLPGNLNANPAIVRSAVMYCFRCLISDDLPLNEGVMDPITIFIPHSLLNPSWHDDPASRAAVSGGNVETSQRICDVIFGALGVVAASQGTMNNVTFGNEIFSYYETIGGGSGAGPNFPGADGVQIHMTNTRITDPEIVERSYPVELTNFSIRHDSGGAGLYAGGNGL